MAMCPFGKGVMGCSQDPCHHLAYLTRTEGCRGVKGREYVTHGGYVLRHYHSMWSTCSFFVQAGAGHPYNVFGLLRFQIFFSAMCWTQQESNKKDTASQASQESKIAATWHMGLVFIGSLLKPCNHSLPWRQSLPLLFQKRSLNHFVQWKTFWDCF